MKTNKLLAAAVLAAAIGAPIAGFLGDTKGQPMTSSGVRVPFLHGFPIGPSANPADAERTFQQQLRELNQLRQMLKDDPEASKEAEDLARQMQHLDPRRFPGNPAMVEEMHRQVLSSIDRLELQLERSATASLASRTGKPQTVPDGYQDSVAEYYRSLSKTQ